MADGQERDRDETLKGWQYFVRRCGISKPEFYRKVGTGELAPAYRTGKKKGIKVPAWVADQWLEDHKIAVEETA